MAEHQPNVFIIESLDREDEEKEWFEGRIISTVLSMNKKRCKYHYIRTKKELGHFLEEFEDSDYRYLHLSCHANREVVATTYDDLSFKEFGRMVRPYLSGRRLFMSACSAVRPALAAEVLKGSGCYSLIGPRDDVGFSEAAAMWAMFYHLVLGEDVKSMNRSSLAPTLSKIWDAYRVYLRYYVPKDRKPGYELVDWKPD